MSNEPLYQDTYSPKFSGHETFPIRHGWLKKVYDRVSETQGDENNKSVCWDNSAIAHFGVGKNMVSSMRHWAKSARIVEEPQKTNLIKTTPFGDKIFGAKGYDPFMEHPATLWLIHWQYAAHPEKTTWYWAFNHFPEIMFDRDSLIQKLGRIVKERNWSRSASTTIRNDVACFINTYVARQLSGKTGHDDAFESPLTELGLIKSIGKKNGFRFVRGSKPTLGDGVFTFALLDFWSRYSGVATLSFETIVHASGSPGRVFALDENDVANRLVLLDEVTDGVLRWSETAGLKQVIRSNDIDSNKALSFLSVDYPLKPKEAA